VAARPGARPAATCLKHIKEHDMTIGLNAANPSVGRPAGFANDLPRIAPSRKPEPAPATTPPARGGHPTTASTSATPNPNPGPTGSPAATPSAPATPDPDPRAAADRVMDTGVRWLIKDDYEQRMDVFAREMSQGSESYRKQLTAEILKRDPGAFQSWLQADRLGSRVEAGAVSAEERTAVLGGLRSALADGTIGSGQVPADFVRDAHDPGLIRTYLQAQKLDDRTGFQRALTAFSGLSPQALRDFVADPGNGSLMRDFSLSVQRHQEWYEQQTIDLASMGGGLWTEQEAPVQFSVDQLKAMRQAFKDDDGLMTHGELLLAYPDRLERNEQVTRQYHEFSQGMAQILGDDNANWPTYAQWASDEIGCNLKGTGGIALGEAGLGNPRYWLSLGNTRLGSDIGPAFHEFVDTFKDGRNRDMSFEAFWSGLEQKWQGRGISYLEGRQDPDLNMKNAFKAYHEAMQLRDREGTTTDASQKLELADRRRELMLYGNVLVGLQEQKLIQADVENGLKSAPMVNGGVVNLAGLGGAGINVHLPGLSDPRQARTMHTDLKVPDSPYGVMFDADTEFVTADGRTIRLQDEMRQRLAGLPGAGSGDPLNRDHSAADHWESYGDRMTYIYHLFAGYQRDPSLGVDPRVAFGSRTQPYSNDPLEVIG
jgi:hypothetical protein